MKNTGNLLRLSLKNAVKLFFLTSVIVGVSTIHTSLADTPNGYVTSKECAECHEKEYKGWSKTLHSKIVQDAKADRSAMLGDFSDPRAKEFAKEYDIELTVGSHWKQRYLVKLKGEYYALPIVWSVVTKRWEDYSVSFWNRMPYSKFCIGCHTTNYNVKDKTYSEHFVGCEACHGPGQKHVESGGDKKFITNPANLPDNLRDMICASCHVKAKDKSKKYTFPVGYKPGDNLADYLFVLKAEDETVEEFILNEFNNWKKNRKAPQDCSVCGIDKTGVPQKLQKADDTVTDFCFGCHNFKDNFSAHTMHSEELDITCSDCHKLRAKDDIRKEPETDSRNIHSYDYYRVHKSGCYDPYIEKQCMKCHKDKDKDWAISLVIDWAVPPDFIHD